MKIQNMASHHARAESLSHRKLEQLLSQYEIHLQAFRTVTGLFDERFSEAEADLETWTNYHQLKNNRLEKEIFATMSNIFTSRDRVKNMLERFSKTYDILLKVLQSSSEPHLTGVRFKSVKDSDDIDECDCDAT